MLGCVSVRRCGSLSSVSKRCVLQLGGVLKLRRELESRMLEEKKREEKVTRKCLKPSAQGTGWSSSVPNFSPRATTLRFVTEL